MRKNFTKTKGYKDAVENNLFFVRVGDSVFKARNQKGLSQGELAKRVKTTQRIISLIENADNYNLGTDLFYRIFKFLEKEVIIEGYDIISGLEAHNDFPRQSVVKRSYVPEANCAFRYELMSTTHNNSPELAYAR